MSKEVVADTLRRAKELISDPNAWTQGCFAEDADGLHVEPRDPSARTWCAVGAIIKVGDDMVVEEAEGVLGDALPMKCQSVVAAFNDDPDTSHGMLMEAFDQAIARAERAA